MNTQYKVVWNDALGCFTAVSELAKSHGKHASAGTGCIAPSVMMFSLKALAAALLMMGFGGQVWAAGATCIDPNTLDGRMINNNISAVGNVSAAKDQVACGQGAVAKGDNTIAIGFKAGVQKITITATNGDDKDLNSYTPITKADGSSIANDTSPDRVQMGTEAFAAGSGSIAIGRQAQAYNSDGTTRGSGSSSAIALGAFAYSNGDQAVSLGARARAEKRQAIAIGNDTRATGVGAVSIGGDDSGDTTYTGNIPTGGGYNNNVAGSATDPKNLFSEVRAFDPNGNSKWRPTFSAGNGSTAIAPHAQALSKGTTAIGVGATAGQGTQGTLGDTELGNL